MLPKTWSRLVISILPALVLSGAASVRADEVDALVKAQMERRHVPGMSLAVIRDGRLVKSAGYGLADLELQVPASASSVYEIGSITKQFTAEAVMLLVGEQRISLEDPVARLVPGVPDAWRLVTVRHLLTHTGGLKDWEAGTTFSYRQDYSADDFIKLMAAFPLDFEPGSQWSYTNTGFPLLGMAVERAAGRPFEELIADRIFKPLNMSATRFKDPADIVPNRARGYVWRDGRFRPGEPARPRVIAPNGGILSSVLDLATWDIALWSGGLLPAPAVRQMLTPARLNDGTNVNHGVAWFMDAFMGHRMVFHHGSTVAGYSGLVLRYPDDGLTVIVLANVDDGALAADAIARRVANAYRPGLFPGGLTPHPDPDPARSHLVLAALRELAANGNPGALASSLRIGPERRGQIADQIRALTAFTYLDGEPLGDNHFRPDRTLQRMAYYRLDAGGRRIFYTVGFGADGKIARLLFDED